MSISSIVIALLILFVVYGLFFSAFAVSKGFEYINLKSVSSKVVYPLLIIATCIFTVSVINQNRFVYFWDYGNYWTLSVALTNEFFASPSIALKNVYVSINTQEYNSFLPLVMCLPLKIFGNSFAKFVLLTHVMFLVPTFVVLIACLNKAGNVMRVNTSGWKTIITNCCVCAFPAFYVAMFRGFIDVAILLPISLIYLITIDHNILECTKRNFFKDIVIALLLVAVLIFRRYTAFFVLGYVSSLALISFLSILESEEKFQKIKCFVINYGVIGMTSLSIMLLFFREFFLNALKTDYAAQYVAYDAPMLSKVQGVVNKIGGVNIIFLLVALGLAFFCYKKLTRFVSILLVNIIVTAGGFFNVQGMGEHHVYILLVQIVLLSMIGIKEIVHICRRKQFLVGIICFALCIFNFAYSFIPQQYVGSEKLNDFFAIKYTPFVRNDISEIERLATYLNSLTQGNELKIYVAASGVILNADIIRSINKPESLHAVPALLSTSEIDLRDGFPITFLDADIIVTTNPIEIHTTPGTQEVVRFLAQEVMDSASFIGECFEEKASFQLDNNVNAYVYVRLKDFSEEAIYYLKEYYGNYYPENYELFGERLDNYLIEMSNKEN